MQQVNARLLEEQAKKKQDAGKGKEERQRIMDDARRAATRDGPFSRFTELRALVLNNNKLRHIDEFTFKGLEKHLEEFHLERNRVRTLAPFVRFEALKVLLMTYNRIGELGEFER